MSNEKKKKKAFSNYKGTGSDFKGLEKRFFNFLDFYISSVKMYFFL